LNQQTLNFISEHWELLLNPSIQEFSTLISASPLQSVALILNSLRDRPLTLQQLSDRTGLHPNSVKSVTRVLEGKLFDRTPQGSGKGASTLISLSVGAIEKMSDTSSPSPVPVPEKSQKTGMYRARLPEKKCYRPIQSRKSEKWVFEDIDSPTFRVVSPVPNPWEQEWNIWASKQCQRADKEPLNTRVDFRLYPVESKDGVVSARIERELIKGYFAWAIDRPYDFFVVQVKERLYLTYSFLPPKD
jgi:hypothetical protein